MSNIKWAVCYVSFWFLFFFFQKCQNPDCQGLLPNRANKCPICKQTQKPVGKRPIDYMPVGKTCPTAEKYRIYGRVS